MPNFNTIFSISYQYYKRIMICSLRLKNNLQGLKEDYFDYGI